jgi:hypothetical protein
MDNDLERYGRWKAVCSELLSEHNVLLSRILSSDGVVYDVAVFWVVAPCTFVQVYQRFRGLYCLHHQGDVWSSP